MEPGRLRAPAALPMPPRGARRPSCPSLLRDVGDGDAEAAALAGRDDGHGRASRRPVGPEGDTAGCRRMPWAVCAALKGKASQGVVERPPACWTHGPSEAPAGRIGIQLGALLSRLKRAAARVSRHTLRPAPVRVGVMLASDARSGERFEAASLRLLAAAAAARGGRGASASAPCAQSAPSQPRRAASLRQGRAVRMGVVLGVRQWGRTAILACGTLGRRYGDRTTEKWATSSWQLCNGQTVQRTHTG